MNKEIKIAMVLSTGGLDYDDRIRKEILSIQKLYPNVKFKVFAILPDNQEYEGVSSYGIPFKAVYLKSRDKYPSATKIIQKGYEFYRVVKNDLSKYDVVWTADTETAFITMLVKTDKLIWDLHELPMGFMNKWYMRAVLKHMFKRCKVCVHANPQRLEYLIENRLISQPEKHFALRNYQSSDDYTEFQNDEKYKKFLQWRGNRKCVYLQGLNGNHRSAYETIIAILSIPDLCAVVIGGYHKESLESLKKEYGNIEDRIYFAGLVLQQSIGQYVEQCHLSVVFYKNINANNWLCDSNRLYMSFLKGLPVVVGCNPSMKELVDQYGLGVAIDDDGGDADKIKKGILEVIDNYDNYKTNVEKVKDYFLWEHQEIIIKEFMDKLLSK